MAQAVKRIPPYCGREINRPLLYSPYQDALLQARRLRVCDLCKTIAPVSDDGVFRCPMCAAMETSQVIAKKAFGRVGIVAGRRFGKTKVGALASREELVVPNATGWVIGPTHRILHDSTMPTFFKLIPDRWVADWSESNKDLLLINGHLVQFRSADDPNALVGQGPHWSWLDEVQKMRERAWDVFRPSLTDQTGNAIFTFTPNGFDWTWRRIYQAAHNDDHRKRLPGFWVARCKTLDSPWIQRYGLSDVEEARRSMPPNMFRQEYEAEFVSFAGNIYDWEQVEHLILRDEEAIRYFIPEWPELNPARETVIGLFGGGTRPFSAVLIVLTERGFVVVDEYISEYSRAVVAHLQPIRDQFLAVHDDKGKIISYQPSRFAASEEASNILTEYAQSGVGVIPTNSYLIDGVERTQTLLALRLLWFAAPHVPRLLDQIQTYRWADYDADAEESSENERDFRRNNELPRALHTALLTWPALPKPLLPPAGRDLSRMPESARREIETMQAYHREETENDPELPVNSLAYPFGQHWGNEGDGEQEI